jgi:hypothetical protein
MCSNQEAADRATTIARLYGARCQAMAGVQVALAKQEAEWASYDRQGRAASEKAVDAAYGVVHEFDQRILASKIEHPSDIKVLAAVNADKRHWGGEFCDAFVVRLLEVISMLLPASPAMA